MIAIGYTIRNSLPHVAIFFQEMWVASFFDKELANRVSVSMLFENISKCTRSAQITTDSQLLLKKSSIVYTFLSNARKFRQLSILAEKIYVFSSSS